MSLRGGQNRNDSKNRANKMIQLIDDPELRIRMAEYGYNRVIKELSWDYESIKLKRFYNQIFQNGYPEKAKTFIPRRA